MADIRVERKSGGHAWLWVLLVVVLIAIAAFLLDRAGYVDIPIDLGSHDPAAAPVRAALGTATHLQEA